MNQIRKQKTTIKLGQGNNKNKKEEGKRTHSNK